MKYKYWAIATFGIFVPVSLLVLGLLAHTQKSNIPSFKRLLEYTADVGVAGTNALLKGPNPSCTGDACAVGVIIVMIVLLFAWLPFLLVVALLLVFFIGLPLCAAYLLAYAYPALKIRETKKWFVDQCRAVNATVNTKQATVIGQALDYDWVLCAYKATTMPLRTELVDQHLKRTAVELRKYISGNKHLMALILEYAAEVHVVYEYADAEQKAIVYAGFDDETAASLVKPNRPVMDASLAGDMPYFCIEEQTFKSNNKSDKPKVWLLRVSCTLNQHVLRKLFD